MSNTTSAANEALASLGLSADASGAVTAKETAPVAEAAPVDAAAPAAADTNEVVFQAGGTEDLSFDEIPALERGFSNTKTKYGFEDIAAPGTDGKRYHGKLVKFEGGDQAKFKRSVQSGATGQNSKSKDAGAPNYYITRTAEKEGQFVGMYIIRTDERPVQAEEAPAAAE